jgi:hypothetical protein
MILETTPSERHDEINQLLAGPRTSTDRTATVDPETGITPPSWWSGDEDATAAAMTARPARTRVVH